MAAVLEDFLLKHAELPYDANKRREYYLKTRELQGRRPGAGGSSSSGGSRPKAVLAPKKNAASNLLEIKQRRDKVEAQVKVLNEKLKQLRIVLKGLKDQSDAANKVKGEKEGQTEKGPSKRKEPTAAQKKDAAKKAQERREDDPDQKLKTAMEKIAKVQQQIKEAREKLQNPGRKKSSKEKPKV